MKTIGTFCNGKEVHPKSNPRFNTQNPATTEILAEVIESEKAEVDACVEAAQIAFVEWSRKSPEERGRILRKAAEILRERTKELAEIECLDTGKPIAEALEVDIATAADALEYYAGIAVTLRGEFYDRGSYRVFTSREPLGVCAGIGAWNYPIQIACWKSAPALACGNTFIFKPSELTPLSAMKLAEIYTEAGLPDGCFQVVQGAADTGRLLTRHPGIAKISFTGEVETGKAILKDTSETLKKTTMELGGKSPLIIFEDCDLEKGVRAALAANFFTQGEVCTNGTRVFVQKSVLPKFRQMVEERLKNVRIGDPKDPKTNVGALISAEHKQKVLSYIESAQTEKTDFTEAGEIPTTQELQKGHFVKPIVFWNPNDSSRVVCEEVFGPVMSVLEFESEEEVVQRANATRFGLAAGVFTNDISRAHRVISALEAGICWINNYNITPMEMPFGGYKESGLGKENGIPTLEHYTNLKSTYLELGDVYSPF